MIERKQENYKSGRVTVWMNPDTKAVTAALMKKLKLNKSALVATALFGLAKKEGLL